MTEWLRENGIISRGENAIAEWVWPSSEDIAPAYGRFRIEQDKVSATSEIPAEQPKVETPTKTERREGKNASITKAKGLSDEATKSEKPISPSKGEGGGISPQSLRRGIFQTPILVTALIGMKLIA